jgi:hypothetical protein
MAADIRKALGKQMGGCHSPNLVLFNILLFLHQRLSGECTFPEAIAS